MEPDSSSSQGSNDPVNPESPPPSSDLPGDEAPRKYSNLQFCAALLFIAIIIVIGVLVAMTMMRPSWYTPPSPDDPKAAEMAQQAEFGLVENLQKIREPGETWRLRIPDEAVNMWLGIRMKKWLAHDDRPPWPDYLGIPQVHSTPSGIQIAVEVTSDGGSTRVIGLQVMPSVVDDSMHLEIVGGLLGRLPVPKPPDALLEKIREGATDGDEASELALKYLLEGTNFPSQLELVDERVVWIDGIELQSDGFILTARTLARNDPRIKALREKQENSAEKDEGEAADPSP